MKTSSAPGSDWALVAATIVIIAVATLQAGRLRIDSDADTFCSSAGVESESSIEDSFAEEKGTRVVLNIGKQHWIWVSCSGTSA